MASAGAQRAMIGVGGFNVDFSTASTSWYFPPGSYAGTTPTLTEAQAETTWRGTGTFRKLRAKAVTNTRTTDSFVRLRVNGSAVLTLTIPGGSTTEQTELATDIAISPGDDVCIQIELGTGTGNLRLRGISWEFATAAGVQVFTHFASSVGTNASTVNRLFTLAGEFNLPTSEYTALEACVISNIVLGVTANANNGTSTAVSRKNAADGAQSIAFTTTETGFKEDTTNSDTLADGDTFGIRLPFTGSGAITVVKAGMKYASTTAGRSLLLSMPSANAMASGTTYYGGPYSKASMGSVGNQTNSEMVVPFDCTISELTAVCTAYAGTATVTVELMKDGVATGYSITFTTTGTYTQGTGSVSFTAGQTVGWKISGQDGNLTLVAVMALLTDTNAV